MEKWIHDLKLGDEVWSIWKQKNSYKYIVFKGKLARPGLGSKTHYSIKINCTLDPSTLPGMPEDSPWSEFSCGNLFTHVQHNRSKTYYKVSSSDLFKTESEAHIRVLELESEHSTEIATRVEECKYNLQFYTEAQGKIEDEMDSHTKRLKVIQEKYLRSLQK